MCKDERVYVLKPSHIERRDLFINSNSRKKYETHAWLYEYLRNSTIRPLDHMTLESGSILFMVNSETSELCIYNLFDENNLTEVQNEKDFYVKSAQALVPYASIPCVITCVSIYVEESDVKLLKTFVDQLERENKHKQNMINQAKLIQSNFEKCLECFTLHYLTDNKNINASVQPLKGIGEMTNDYINMVLQSIMRRSKKTTL